MTQKGTLSVQTENILPIIKRYLYSDQEIFLRELVSNAVDASQKLRTLANRGEVQSDIGELHITVSLDEQNRTLTISDQGVGMTAEEVERYITQIAFSGAQEFLAKYENANSVIGHFGLGFYSAFMVADKVEIITLSHKPNAQAVRWVSDGGTEYEMENAEKTTRGTDIILHLSQEADEYNQQYRISELLNKYCRFLPIPICFGHHEEESELEDQDGNKIMQQTPTVINIPQPAWTKQPAELSKEDYIEFYRQLHPYAEEPLFWIHLNVDYPFKLTGILYFPKIENRLEFKREHISLYCNQVFVTEQTENIVPEFLTLLHGVIDSPDIPLNVSRSYLQSDPEVKKINKYITRKVADRLSDMFRNEREEYEKKWEGFELVVKYGIISDQSFAEKVAPFCLFQDLDDKAYTLDELKEAVAETQTDKHQKLVLLYTNNPDEQHTPIENVKAKGYKVLYMNAVLDPHFIQNTESRNENLQFKRVDSASPEHLIEKEESTPLALSEREEKTTTDLFARLCTSPGASVTVSSMSPEITPVQVVRNEQFRRMKEMAQLGGGMDYMRNMPDTYNVVINGNHPIVGQLANIKDETEQAALAQQLYDLALLEQNMLKGADLANFVQRSIGLLKK